MAECTELVFETHSPTEDNERGVATGWSQGRLSGRGRALALELGERRRCDGVAAVFTSDLARAVETATIAFADTGVPVFHDWRLRECDYGDLNGAPAATVLADRSAHLDAPYPHGESWHGAVARVTGFLDGFPARYQRRRVLLIGHVATRWALDIALAGRQLRDLVDEEFAWQPGWEYRLRHKTAR
ncbi:MAG TPA: histidine phosphatase family protein [Acidimicrobiia bacterium]|jgi:alpha-ribazole phosphatase/probable phosphoglycerate mutase